MGLQHLLRQPSQQTARADEINPVRTRPVNKLLSQRPLRPVPIVITWRLRHHHILLGDDLSLPASEPLTVSGQTSYTAADSPDEACPT